MSIETRTQQSTDDTLPEGREPDARQDAPSQVAFDEVVPDQPNGDALPLDGSLTLNDTEPQDQSGRTPAATRILTGSEAGGIANGSVEGGAGADAALDSNDPSSAAPANPDPSIG